MVLQAFKKLNSVTHFVQFEMERCGLSTSDYTTNLRCTLTDKGPSCWYNGRAGFLQQKSEDHPAWEKVSPERTGSMTYKVAMRATMCANEQHPEHDEGTRWAIISITIENLVMTTSWECDPLCKPLQSPPIKQMSNSEITIEEHRDHHQC